MPVQDDSVGPPLPPATYEVELQQEGTRKYLAIILLGILTFEVVGAIVWVFVYKSAADVTPMKEILSVIFTPTVALVAAATGFYFGSNSTSKTQPNP